MGIKSKINRTLYPKHLFYDPEWIVLGVNNLCNLSCKMCDVGVGYNESNFFENLMGSRPLNMPLELLEDIINQMSKYFTNTKLGYAFTEPLIYPHLIESLNLAKSKNIFTSITTNGLNLKRYADGLLNSEINEINISLDGPQEIHNYIRGHKSSFQKAVEGIDYILGIKPSQAISIYCVITEWNIGHLVEFVDYFKDYPLRNMGFMHTNFTSKESADKHNALYSDSYFATPSNMEEISIDAMNLDQLWSDIQKIKKLDTKFPIKFSPEISSRELLETFYHHPDIFLGKRCNDVFNNIMIKSNGDVIPAHGRCYNLTIGNIYDDNIKEIWNSNIITKFRQTLNADGGLLPACSRCCSAFSK